MSIQKVINLTGKDITMLRDPSFGEDRQSGTIVEKILVYPKTDKVARILFKEHTYDIVDGFAAVRRFANEVIDLPPMEDPMTYYIVDEYVKEVLKHERKDLLSMGRGCRFEDGTIAGYYNFER